MSNLKTIHRGLGQLRRRKWLTRTAIGVCGLLLAVAWVLMALFGLDWLLEMSRAQRVVALLCAAAGFVWAARRYVVPWLGRGESELDLALEVEQEQKLESDLVAALQFEQPEAADWGSAQLEGAVIDYVADFGRGWNPLDGFSTAPLGKRSVALLVTLLLLGAAVLWFPRHAATFLSRLGLSNRHYPTQTTLTRIEINGQPVEWLPTGEATARCPFGQPLEIRVVTEGALPTAGRADLAGVHSGVETSVELTPERGASTETTAAPADGSGSFLGRLPRLVDAVDCQLFLGDAWTEPARLEVIPLPVVEAELRDTPPSYARDTLPSENQTGRRQLAVVEGSRVDVAVRCHNKPLREVALLLGEERLPLQPADDSGQAWSLDVAGTPLERVTEPITYRIEAVDADGLAPQRPLRGFIRLKADRPPQVSGSVVTQRILPTARPTIGYRAADDYGLADLVLHIEVAREGRETTDVRRLELLAGDDPLLHAALPLRDKYVLNIDQFDVAKGDQLKLTLEAIDYRGRSEGQSTLSEPLVLDVTDESGVMTAITESDERSVRQLDTIIKRQLGIGGQP